MTTWVYFVLCTGNRLYIGVGSDPYARFQRHLKNQGARCMRLRRPIQLVGALPFTTRTEALSKEYAFKKLRAAEKRRVALLAASHPDWLRIRDVAAAADIRNAAETVSRMPDSKPTAKSSRPRVSRQVPGARDHD